MKDYNKILEDWVSVEDGIQYAKDIVNDKILSCKMVKLACKRFLYDLDYKQHDDNFRWTFDVEAAQHALNFLAFLEYPDGDVAGQPMRPHLWHTFFIINAFGWVDKNDDEIRRFTDLLAMVARKNSKSTLISALIMYDFFFSPDKSELYLVARNRDQAKIVFNKVEAIARTLPEEFRGSSKSVYGSYLNPETLTKIVPLSKDSKSQDGLNAYRAVFDEFAAITDRNSIEVITSSQGAQKSPQNHYITTAQPKNIGETLFLDNKLYCESILMKNFDDLTPAEERTFALLYSLDDEEEWDKIEMMEKANPSIIEMPPNFVEKLSEDIEKAKISPAAKANFCIKHCNLFVDNLNAWIDTNTWKSNKIDIINKKTPCYLAVDMSEKSDITSICLCFTDGKEYHLMWENYLPRKAFDNAGVHIQGTYIQAKESGALTVLPGEVIDDRFIKERIKTLCETYQVKEIAVDPVRSVRIIPELEQEKYNVIQYRQTAASLTPAIIECEAQIIAGKIRHEGCPFIQWQINNACLEVRNNDLVSIEKGSVEFKIDAVDAMIMAVGRAFVNGALKRPKAEIVFF